MPNLTGRRASGYRAVGFFFLLAVLGIGLYATIGPIMLAAVMSALVWDVFFIPPPYTFVITEFADVVMCLAYFVAAATTGTLTHRIRRLERLIRRRENQTQVLYDVVRALVSRPDRMGAMRAAAKRLGEVLNTECWVISITLSGDLDRGSMRSFDDINDDKEWAVAQWAFQQRRSAGWATDTLLGAQAMAVGKQAYLAAIDEAGFMNATVVAESLFPMAEQDDRLRGKILSIQVKAWK